MAGGSWFRSSPAKPRAPKVSLLLFYLLLPGWVCLNKPQFLVVASGPCAVLRCALPWRLPGLGALGEAGRHWQAQADHAPDCVTPRAISEKPNSLAGYMHVQLMGEEVSQPLSLSQLPFISYSLHHLPKGPGTALIEDGVCDGVCQVKYACFLHE